MKENFIIGQVKNMIKGAIIRFADELDVNSDRISLWIYYKEANSPGLRILCDLKPVKNIGFGELASTTERFIYKGLGFDVAKDTPIWIYKFMERVSIEKAINIETPCYYLRIYNNELIAFMFLDGKKAIFNDEADDSADNLAKYKISIEYIMETR